MSILGAIAKILPKLASRAVPQVAEKALPQVAKKAGLTAGQKWAIGGGITAIGTIFAGYEVTDGQQRRIEDREREENGELFAKKQEIWEDQDINRFDRAWRRVKSWFSDQDVESKTRKYLDNEYTNDPEELQRAGREYIKELLGQDIKNLTPKEKEKRYREALREFYMQLTSLGLDEERSEQILAGAIGELQADTRSSAVKDFIELGAHMGINNSKSLEMGDALALNKTSMSVGQRRARFAQQCAPYNLTHLDAFNKAPTQQQALEYQFHTFSHMSYDDIVLSLNDLEKVKDIFVKINNGESLTSDEKKLLETFGTASEPVDMDLLKQNYITGGYAGAYAGIPANGYLLNEAGNPDTATVQKLLSQIYKATEDLGISNEVFGALNEFLNKNPDVIQRMAVHGISSFENIKDVAAGKVKLVEDSSNNGSGGTAYKALGDRTGNPARSTGGGGENNITEIDPGAAPRSSEDPDADGGVLLVQKHHNPKNVPITNPMDTVQRYWNPAIKRENSCADDAPVCDNIEEAVSYGVKAVKKYVKDKHLSDYTAFNKIMQTNLEDKDVYNYAVELFGRLDPGLQVCAFSLATVTNQHELYVKMDLANKTKLDLDKCNLSPDLRKQLEKIRTNEIHNLHLENVYQEENMA